jgi:hypothetical protein
MRAAQQDHGCLVLRLLRPSSLLDQGGWGFCGTTYDYDNNDYGAAVSDVVVGPSDLNPLPWLLCL